MKTSKILILLFISFLICFSSYEDDCEECDCEKSVLFKGQYTTYTNILNDSDGVQAIEKEPTAMKYLLKWLET